MIRVLHVVPGLGLGGAERMATNLMRTLNREQFDVGAISLFDSVGSDLDDILAHNNIPVWYLGKRRGLDPRMFIRVALAIKRFRPHVVHTHMRVLRYVLPYIMWHPRPAIIHTVHSLAEREVDWAGRLVQRIAFRRGVIPVAIAKEVAEGLRRIYGVDGFPLIPNGIPVDTFRRRLIDRETWRRAEGFAPADVLFVCVAGLRPVKNPVLLLEAFARVLASEPQAHLLLVGRGVLRPHLERQIDALGLRERAHLLGMRFDVPDILNAAEVFVLSSDWEGNPLSVMEAMAAGKPVICTAVGGVPELVEDGNCGLLVPRRDTEALAKAMKYMVENSAARTSMGRASARRALEHFDLRTMTKTYEDLYRTTIAKA